MVGKRACRKLVEKINMGVVFRGEIFRESRKLSKRETFRWILPLSCSFHYKFSFCLESLNTSEQLVLFKERILGPLSFSGNMNSY